jgi:hypothetical protein
MKKLIQFLVLAVVLISCDQPSPDCGDPGSSSCDLILTDMNGNLLIGTSYFTDSISLTVNKAIVPISFINGVIRFSYAGLESCNTSDYILRLNKNEADTLNIYVRKYKTECWTAFAIDTLKYNNQIIEALEENRYYMRK